MSENRFSIGFTDRRVVVVDMPPDQINALGPNQRDQHVVIQINYGGIISKQLAFTWAEKLCEQLNQFDRNNHAVGKLL